MGKVVGKAPVAEERDSARSEASSPEPRLLLVESEPLAAPPARLEETMASETRGYRIPVLVSTIAMLVVLYFYWRMRLGNPLPTIWIYWGALVVTLLPGLLSRTRLAMGWSVALFVFLQCFAYPLSAPNGIVYYTDPIFNLQSALSVAQRHTWAAGVGTGPSSPYSFYPGQSLFQVAFSFASGLPLTTTLLFSTELVRFLVIPLALYQILIRFLGEKPRMITVAIYFAVPSYIFNLPVQQEFAFIFLVLAFHSALLAPWAKTRYALSLPALVTTMFFLATVAVSHYFTAYVLSGFLLLLGLASFRRERGRRERKASPAVKRTRGPTSRALLGFRYAAPAYAFIFLMWSIYVSSSIDLGWVRFGQSAFLSAIGPGASLGGVSGSSGGVRPGYTYSTIEFGLILGALVIIVLSSLLGASVLIASSRRRPQGKRPAARVLLTLFGIGIVLGLVTAPLILTAGLYIPLRVLEFAGLGILPFCALSVAYLMARRPILTKPAVAVALAIVVVGGCLVQVPNPRLDLLPQDVQYCEMPPHLTSDVVAAAEWARAHINNTPDLQVFGDELMSDSFGGYGGFTLQPATDPAYWLFDNTTTANVTLASLARNADLRPGDIVLVDKYMTTSICFEGHRSTPMSPSSLQKFDGSTIFQEIFNNTAVKIYRYAGT